MIDRKRSRRRRDIRDGRVRFFGFLLVALFSTGCSSPTEPTLTLWQGDLHPVPPGQVHGVVGAVSQFGRTEVSIEIRGADAGASYSWQIDIGNCQSAGQIQGNQAQYPLLVPDETGSATEDMVLAKVFPPESQLAARVHRALAGGDQETVACGELQGVQ